MTYSYIGKFHFADSRVRNRDFGGNILTGNIKSESPNSDEIDFWNGPQGQNWVDQNRLTDLMYDPFGAKAMECAALEPGQSVLEVGCGCGSTTIKLANLVAPNGRVTAMDVSTLMLSIAEERTKSAAVPVKLITADAEIYDFSPGAFDVVFSQFGVMFFANPEVAFANFYRALKPGGRIVFVCWRDLEQNPWFITPYEAVRHHFPEIERPRNDVPQSGWSLVSKEKVENLLGGAGFMDVRLDPFDAPAQMGEGSLDACIDYVSDFVSPVAAIIRGAGVAATPAILATLRSEMAQYHTENGIRFPAAMWIVSGRRS